MDPELDPRCSPTLWECQLALHLQSMAWNQRPVTSASQHPIFMCVNAEVSSYIEGDHMTAPVSQQVVVGAPHGGVCVANAWG